MKRLGGLLLVVLAPVLVAACGGSTPSATPSTSAPATPSASSSVDPGTITRYEGDLTVDARGNLSEVETLTVDFPDARHGIFRDFEKPLPLRTSISVTRDGKPEPMTTSTSGGVLTAKIGDPDVTLTGEHVYRITYAVPSVLQTGDAGTSAFVWNLIGKGWDVPIQSSSFTVHLPAPASAASCTEGAKAPVDCAGVGTQTLTFTTGPLGLDASVGINARFEVPSVDF